MQWQGVGDLDLQSDRDTQKREKPDNDDDTNSQNNHTAGTKVNPVSSFMQQREAGGEIHSSVE